MQVSVENTGGLQRRLTVQVPGQEIQQKVETKLNIGAREVYIKGVQDGSVDVVPEYTGVLRDYFADESGTSAEASDAEGVFEELKAGMRLEGRVTNVTNFGAFVDVGVNQDGLVQESMSNIESVVESYISSWNETDAGRRKSALAASCTENASYRDPVMVSETVI